MISSIFLLEKFGFFLNFYVLAWLNAYPLVSSCHAPANKRLREMDPAAYMEANGFDPGKNLYGIIMHVEENGPDIIELSKENKALKHQMSELKKESKEMQLKYMRLEKRLDALENKQAIVK